MPSRPTMRRRRRGWIAGSRDRLRNVLVVLRARLWLIPCAMSLAAAVAARLLSRLDDAAWFADPEAWWYFGGDADTARDLLSTLLSGMITMTSLVISITMVVLTLAANQLGPRLIWNFVRDRQIQAVIGLFFATIAFILVVSRSITAQDVPAAAVTAATALVTACLFALLFHIDKVASSIIADNVIDDVATALLGAVDALMESRTDEPASEAPPPARARHPVSLARSGYVQVVEYDRLRDWAAEHDALVEIDVRAGHFLLPGGEHLRVVADVPPGREDLDFIRRSFVLGTQRTATQDVEYAIRQLVEIAVRALSPGINDPTTASSASHRLGEAIERLMACRLDGILRKHDADGTLRVIGVQPDFRGLVDAALNQLRQAAAARGNEAVLIGLCTLLGQLAASARSDAQIDALATHLDMLAGSARRVIAEPRDLADFEDAHRRARSVLRSGRA